MRKSLPFKYSVCPECKANGKKRVKELKQLKTMTCDKCGKVGLDGSPTWFGSMPTADKPVPKSLHPIKDEAQKRLNKAWSEKDEGKRMTAQGIVTAKQVLAAYKVVHPDWNSSKKIKGYIRAFEHVVRCLEAQKVYNLNSITTQQLRNCETIMLNTEKKPGVYYGKGTVHSTIRNGRLVIASCDDINKYTKAELYDFATEKVPSTKNRITYTAEEIKSVLKGLKQTIPWFEVYYKIAYYTGMRRDHIISLTWAEIKTTSEGAHFETYPAKSKRVTPTLIDIDNELLNILNEWREEINVKYPDTPFLFPSPVNPKQHQVSSGDTVDRHIRKLREITGLVGLNLHTMRHNFITTKFKEGYDVRAVMHTVGHSNITQTQEYAHDTAKDSLARMRMKPTK